MKSEKKILMEGALRPNLQKTWSSNENAGIEGANDLAGPSPFFSNPGLDVSTATVPVNQFADTLTTAVPITIDALPDNAQMKYTEGLPLFGIKNIDDIDKNSTTAFGLWYINYLLERGYIRRVLEQKGRVGVINVERDGKIKRKMAENNDSMDKIPVTIQEFINTFNWLGIFNTSNTKNFVRKRNISIAVRGEMRMANIFGAEVNVNDIVYLHVKQYQNDYDSFYDWKGNVIAPHTPGSFLQVHGGFEPDTNYPIHSTRLRGGMMSKIGDTEMKKQDLDFFENSIVQQRIYDRNPNNTISWDKHAEGPKIVTNLYQQGLAIKLGRVIRKGGRDPLAIDIKKALRSSEDYTNLMGYSDVEVELEAFDSSNPFWC